jgi:hypothetical protein
MLSLAPDRRAGIQITVKHLCAAERTLHKISPFCICMIVFIRIISYFRVKENRTMEKANRILDCIKQKSSAEAELFV